MPAGPPPYGSRLYNVSVPDVAFVTFFTGVKAKPIVDGLRPTVRSILDSASFIADCSPRHEFPFMLGSPTTSDPCVAIAMVEFVVGPLPHTAERETWETPRDPCLGVLAMFRDTAPAKARESVRDQNPASATAELVATFAGAPRRQGR